MAQLLDRVRCVTPSRGVGPCLLGPALGGGRAFVDAGATNGALYTCLIQDVGGAWEICQGTYSQSNNSIGRDILVASSTGDFLNLSGNATVTSGAMALDYNGSSPYEARSLDPVPKVSDFTIQNISGGVSFTNVQSGILCVVPANTNLGQGSLFKPLPATPCSVYVRFRKLVAMHQFSSFDVMALNNGSGRLNFMETSSRLNETSNQWQLGYFWGRYNNLTSFNATLYTQTLTAYPLWYRLDFTGANGLITPYVSPDGYSWTEMGNPELSSNWAGSITHVGFGCVSANTGGAFVISAFTTRPPV